LQAVGAETARGLVRRKEYAFGISGSGSFGIFRGFLGGLILRGFKAAVFIFWPILQNGLLTLLSNFSAHKFVWGNCIGRCTGIE
jgi:hypothetical protein